jgi:hypothetical protein
MMLLGMFTNFVNHIRNEHHGTQKTHVDQGFHLATHWLCRYDNHQLLVHGQLSKRRGFVGHAHWRGLGHLLHARTGMVEAEVGPQQQRPTTLVHNMHHRLTHHITA